MSQLLNTKYSPGTEIAAELVFRFEGSFRGGLANGRGTLITKDDDKIEGEFEEHMPHGKIIMQRANGERIEGQFRQAQLMTNGAECGNAAELLQLFT